MVRRALPVCMLFVACAAGPAFGQAVSGTILGTVTEASGGVLPAAKVTAISEETGTSRSTTADANGEFTFPSLPPGHYTVTAEVAGFRTLAISNIELGVDQHLRIDLKLLTGAAAETVNVVGSSPLVQTSTSELGTTVGGAVLHRAAVERPEDLSSGAITEELVRLLCRYLGGR